MPSSRTSRLGVIALSWSDDSAVQEKTEPWAEIKEGLAFGHSIHGQTAGGKP